MIIRVIRSTEGYSLESQDGKTYINDTKALIQPRQLQYMREGN
jgi:hypothetical protein